MPELSRFLGIVIKMYFQQSEHNPPHIHAIYNDTMAEIDIRNGNVLQGDLSPRVLSLVLEWLNLHKEELLRMWETQEFSSIEPLE